MTDASNELMESRLLQPEPSQDAFANIGRVPVEWGVPLALVSVLAAVWMAHFPPVGGLFTPQTNQGIYLYIGWLMLHGGAPYRDVFDNKGPLLYLVNALGLGVARGSCWGVYLIEYLLFASATVLGFLTLKRMVGLLAASVAMLFFIVLLNRVLLGNTEEEYVIPVQWAALYFLATARPAAPRLRVYLFLGVLGSLPLFLKPTEVGLWVAIVVVEVVLALSQRDVRTCTKRLAAMVVGGLIGSAAFLAYLGSLGILHTFIQDYVIYNFAYSDASSWQSRLSSVNFGAGFFGHVTTAAVFVLWILACWMAFLSWRDGSRDRLVYLAVVWWPLEVIFSSVSGLRHHEFYLTWTVPMVLLLAVALSWSAARLREWRHHGTTRAAVAVLWIVLVALAGTLAPLEHSAHSLGGLLIHPKYWSSPPRNAHAVARYIDAHTGSKDLVLVWGGYSANIDFLAQRRAPTRFAAQMVLYWTTGNSRGQLVGLFLNDLKKHPPAMIVDTSPTYGGQAGGTPSLATPPGTWPLGPPALRESWSRVFSYLQSTYVESTTLPFYPHWVVYRRERQQSGVRPRASRQARDQPDQRERDQHEHAILVTCEEHATRSPDSSQPSH